LRRKLTKLALREARRHPRIALKLTASAVSHPRRTTRLVRIARRAPTIAQDAPTRRKARAAAAAASRAATRARDIGPSAVVSDKRFLAELRRAAQATIETYQTATKPKRRWRRLRRLTLGATLLIAALYATRRQHTQQDGK
jgi:hypothetical protein